MYCTITLNPCASKSVVRALSLSTECMIRIGITFPALRRDTCLLQNSFIFRSRLVVDPEPISGKLGMTPQEYSLDGTPINCINNYHEVIYHSRFTFWHVLGNLRTQKKPKQAWWEHENLHTDKELRIRLWSCEAITQNAALLWNLEERIYPHRYYEMTGNK